MIFCNDPTTTEIYTLSLHDALPIFEERTRLGGAGDAAGDVEVDAAHERGVVGLRGGHGPARGQCCVDRSEEHTSELQSRLHLVCRLLLEKKKKAQKNSGYLYNAYSV